ncbi:MAG: hypothetical protein J5449_02685 [Oscillospiraceae bacterium]|nr:hypothetical protein [Oscillospiraceae bacterium]
MSAVYELKLRLGSDHVDCFRRLRTSALFGILQSASIRHTEELGAGREKTLDKGLLWVVTHQYVTVGRMPEYDEQIVVRTWPGETMHLIFPRYYELVSANGETLARGSALWSLMDRATRTVAFPDEHGVMIPGTVTGREVPYLTKLETIEAPNHSTFSVPYSYVDLNGHMNNTRYFDLAEDVTAAPEHGRILREARVEYSAEAKLADTVEVSWGEKDGMYYVNGSCGHPCFRMDLFYSAT